MSIKKHLLVLALGSFTACGLHPGNQNLGVSSSEAFNGREDSSDKKNEDDALSKTQQLFTIESSIPSDWVRISANGFSFSVPPDMVERDVQGIDSYVGAYRNSRLDLLFDYGVYTVAAKNPDELIDGKKSKITERDTDSNIDGIPFKKLFAVNFEDIGRSEVNLSMYIYGKTSADQTTAEIIFRSIRID